uniref:Uncharacterized protein n=1 Tax=Glossina pallidipes TaxID=7398 RepID=A0A1A9Z1M8_GLOPL
MAIPLEHLPFININNVICNGQQREADKSNEMSKLSAKYVILTVLCSTMYVFATVTSGISALCKTYDDGDDYNDDDDSVKTPATNNNNNNNNTKAKKKKKQKGVKVMLSIHLLALVAKRSNGLPLTFKRES